MSTQQETSLDPVVLLSAHRLRALRRAGDLLLGDAAADMDEAATSAELAALLAASLEELKVAEEELREKNDMLQSGRLEIERELARYRTLFELAPTPLLVTDLNGGIRQSNEAAERLLRLDAYLLRRKPLALLVAKEDQASFRACLARLPMTGSASGWRLRLRPRGDLPVAVAASVSLLPHEQLRGELLWELRPDEQR